MHARRKKIQKNKQITKKHPFLGPTILKFDATGMYFYLIHYICKGEQLIFQFYCNFITCIPFFSMAIKFINETAFDSMQWPNNEPLPQNILSGARYTIHISKQSNNTYQPGHNISLALIFLFSINAVSDKMASTSILL